MTCAHCSLPIERALVSEVLGVFCSWRCYEAAWRYRMPKNQPRGGLPVQDDVDYVDMEGPNETVVG